jgi:hypothetical protein
MFFLRILLFLPGIEQNVYSISSVIQYLNWLNTAEGVKFGLTFVAYSVRHVDWLVWVSEDCVYSKFCQNHIQFRG